MGSIQGTRPRLLSLLLRQGQATVDQMAEGVGLASATVRRHLDILQRDHLVSFHEVRHGAGRPEYSYHLTEAGHESLPKAYDSLLVLLLQEMAAESGGARARALFASVARRVAEPYVGSTTGGLEGRTAVLLHVLEQQGFSPQVERAGNSLRIRLFNCPFRSAALADEAVCQMDQNLISAILNTPATKQECISRGASSCCYLAHLQG